MPEPIYCEYCGREVLPERQAMPEDMQFCSAECRMAAEKQDPGERGRQPPGRLLVAGRSPWSR